MKAQFAAEKAAEEAAEEAAKAEKAAKAKAMAARDATIAGNAELWTANMPEHVINSFL